MKKISLLDISEKLKISKSTISIVLNGRGDEKRVSKETQEKIVKYANEHNYRPNQLARGLSRGKSETIGLIVPNISDTFYSRIARRIERKARLSGYTVVYSSTGESRTRENELIQMMLDRQVDGLIIASTQKNQEDVVRLKNQQFPFVLIDRHYPDVETNFVVVDNAGGTSKAVEQLIKLGKKHIGFVTLKPGLEAIRQRLIGYEETLKKYGLYEGMKNVKELDPDHLDCEMMEAIKSLVQSTHKVDGIVFATHYLTTQGLRELRKLSVKIPHEIAIVSFGQMSFFDLIEPPITSVNQPVEEIGDKAVEILLDNLVEKKLTYDQQYLKTKLEIRKSCGKN
ncbi:MAG: LacI family transcriptional regulator [Cytophagales bacterium]|nr:LacI family transcriptional regulator [Cytophagales bacterium]